VDVEDQHEPDRGGRRPPDHGDREEPDDAPVGEQVAQRAGFPGQRGGVHERASVAARPPGAERFGVTRILCHHGLAMIEYRFGRDDVLRTRFALSPLFELFASVVVLGDPARQAMQAPWVARARARLGSLDLAPLAALARPGGYSPDFVAPPPRSPLPDVAEELARVRATPAAQVRRELALAFGDEALPAPLAALGRDPAAALGPLVALMGTYWERALAPEWDAIRDALEADVLQRARRLSAGGPLAVFGDLHPEVEWSDGALRVGHGSYAAVVDLGGRGLLLIPSAFSWPGVRCMLDPPWQPALIYPPTGVAALWAPAEPAAEGALASLIGRRRAEVLAALDAPASTTAVARRLGASPAGVSEHLGVLRRAGLVHPARAGRAVLYARTALGEALARQAA
jgi:DNA-binding transcriptional ArsR family regulator